MRKHTFLTKSDQGILLGSFLIALAAAIIVTMTGCSDAYPVQGSTGPQGAPGASPVVQIQPASGVACPAGGIQISINTTVSYVCNGSDGLTGLPGADGKDAEYQVVQFCPGTTVYPSQFNEVGFIINGKIYGVYSIHDGALVYLPPGAYSSNVVNSSCNFVINPDNSISH